MRSLPVASFSSFVESVRLNDPSPSSMRIAIIGMARRLPGGVSSPAELWKLLREGRHGIREVPPAFEPNPLIRSMTKFEFALHGGSPAARTRTSSTA
ncbi:beta-ketoacyl synthase N-terminal-like domain-containing protein [Polyangium mundeleinium]|uniref:Beta-ketoacyl synthase N-terminal-like domain-containing protein n=1 Tax=Polyangium mundeleinium TaxID=2995306 RepID=A0ABT5F1G1_9BACT|nr:beta-ketoacyl synthase N-terminal-like domain-containing protein [Polyangium mundeleinium]MDC0747923.1 beta-ketoacyl synthase N-terminal-like domain-containing protein [Polyangium mundeleinium]